MMQVPTGREREAILACLGQELGFFSWLQPHLTRLAEATPGFLASDLGLLLTRISTQQNSGRQLKGIGTCGTNL